MLDLLLTIFRFNPKTDYLPHYKKQSITIDHKKTLSDLLKEAVSKRALVGLPRFGVKINGLAIALDTPIYKIHERFGNKLEILPLSTRRSVEDLSIDTKDFYERFDLLAPYVKKVDREYFESLILFHYASPVLSYEKDIFGTAFYIFAAKMIEKYPNFKEEIADIASDEKKGVNFHLPLKSYLFNTPDSIEEDILNLRKTVKKYFPNRINLRTEKESSSENNLATFLNVSYEDIPNALKKMELKHSFSGFKAAVYYSESETLSSSSKAIIDFTKLKTSTISRSWHNNGANIYEYKPNLACKMSGDILLETLDGGYDFLLIEDEKALLMLDTKQKDCAKAVGRKINLPVLTTDELGLIALGEIELSDIKKHAIIPQFLPG